MPSPSVPHQPQPQRQRMKQRPTARNWETGRGAGQTGRQISTEMGILRLGYSFLEIKEDLESIRYIPANGLVMATTTVGEVIKSDRVKLNDDLTLLNLTTLIASMKSCLGQDISDTRKLLRYGLIWLLADVYGLPQIWEEMLHPSAEMFGNVGKADILSFKHDLLVSNDTENYRVDAIHQIDLLNRVIVADFECMLKKKEGRGTDVLKFDENWKVIRVNAVRHGQAMFQN